MNILRVAPCSEFRVRDALHRLGLLAYVPVEFSVSKFSRGHESIRKAPITRGYIFAKSDAKKGAGISPMEIIPEDWLRLSQASDLNDVLKAIKGRLHKQSGEPYVLTPSQEYAIMMLSKPLQRANANGWSPNDKVRLRRGAMAEIQAIVLAVKKKGVVVGFSMMGKKHMATVKADQLEAA